jgi:hypothetical protein
MEAAPDLMFNGPKPDPHLILTGKFYSDMDWSDAQQRFARTYPYQGEANPDKAAAAGSDMARNRRMSYIIAGHDSIKQPQVMEDFGITRVTKEGGDVVGDVFKMMDPSENIGGETFSMQEVMELAVLHEKQMHALEDTYEQMILEIQSKVDNPEVKPSSDQQVRCSFSVSS